MIDGRIYATVALLIFLLYCSAPAFGWTHPWFDRSLKIAGVLLATVVVVAGLDFIWFRL